MEREHITDEEIRQDLTFAFGVSQDKNAYTADEGFWAIQETSAKKNLKDKEYLHSMCPVVAWK